MSSNPDQRDHCLWYLPLNLRGLVTSLWGKGLNSLLSVPLLSLRGRKFLWCPEDLLHISRCDVVEVIRIVFPAVLCPLFCETRIGIAVGAILCCFNTREGVTGVFGPEYPMVCLRSLLF